MKLLILFSFLFAFNCNAQKEKLQGLWNSSWSERMELDPFLALDEGFRYIYHNTDLYFEGDSLWNLEFPCKRFSVQTYLPSAFKLLNDSTFEYNGEKFSRIKNYDSAAIVALKKHELNSECYSGKWFLVRTESGGDGTGVEFIFPFKVKDEINLSDNALDGKTLKIRTSGEEKEFNFALEREMFEYYLVLTPTENWSKQDRKMWYRSWDLPPPTKRELKQIKSEEGVELELRFRRI